jgi:hypothetical protein
MAGPRIVTKWMETLYLTLLATSFVQTTWMVRDSITAAHWLRIWVPHGLALGIVFAVHVLWRQHKENGRSEEVKDL